MLKGKRVMGVCTGLVVAILLLANSPTLASGSPLWGEMKPGPYAIGFKTVEMYDYTRLIMPKSDYLGNPIPGNKARPLQICIWYPAQTTNEATMVFAEYSFPIPNDDELFGFVSEIQDREIQYLQRRNRGGAGFILSLNNFPMAAVKNAPEVAGSFPLIVYEPDRGMGIAENATMLEYLASHGYIVVTTHSTGTASLNPEENYQDLESMIRDKQFLIGYMHNYPEANIQNIGAIGCGFGGFSALALAMRTTSVEAAMLLGDLPATPAGFEFLTGHPFLALDRYNKSLLMITSSKSPANESALLNHLTYSNRHAFIASAGQEPCFSLYDASAVLISDADQATKNSVIDRYNQLCVRTRSFFDATLKGQVDQLENFSGPTDYTYHSIKGDELPPNSIQFTGILMSGDVAKAVELSQKFNLCNPDDPIIPENMARDLGYRFLRRGRSDDAIEIFKMYTLLYPSHANSWDCLAETYAHIGDTVAAIKSYQTALDKLSGDDSITDDFRERLRQGAKAAIEDLQKP